jgi:hypothetical protein
MQHLTLDTAQLLAIAAALGWASGLRLYAVVFLTGMAGFLGWVDLPVGLKILQSPVMLVASGLMLFIEFFADKIPGLDSLWDMIHTWFASRPAPRSRPRCSVPTRRAGRWPRR